MPAIPSILKPIRVQIRRGVESNKDASVIPVSAMAEAVNINLDADEMPTKTPGRMADNTEVGTNTPIKGRITYTAEDGIEYDIIATNNLLYYSTGNGTYSAVKYKNENVNIAINTASYWYNFEVYDVSGAKVIHCVTDDYPISDTANGTNNKYCTISRGLYLYVSGGVIYGKNIYYDSDGSRTAGSDDVEVGASASEIGYPKQAKYLGKIYDRLVAVNCADAQNGWIASEAQNSLDWTNSSGAANLGAGKDAEPFTGAIFTESFFLCFTRTRILRVDCTPTSISNWRESWITSTYGNVGRNIIIHSDGLIYFISEKGLCRTDGRYVEKVDYKIEKDIKDLGQLKQNMYTWTQTTTTDWNGGTPTDGGKILETADGMLAMHPQSSEAEFEAGTKSCVDTDVSSGEVIAGARELGNPSFEDGTEHWSMGGWAIASDSPQSGTYYAKSALSQFGFIHFHDVEGDYITSVALEAVSSWTQKTIDTSDVEGNDLRGRVISIRFGKTAASAGDDLVSENFSCPETSISFYYKRGTVNAVDNVVLTYTSTECSLISQTLDFGTTPSSFGNLAAEEGSGTPTIVYQTRSSSNGSSWSAWANIGAAGANGGVINSTAARYLQWKLIITATAGTWKGIKKVYVGAQWVSATKNIGSTPSSWGPFITDDVSNGQTITYELDTSTNGSSWDGYVAVTSGAIPSNTLRQYFRLRITLNTTSYASLPYVNEVRLTYYLGTAGGVLPCLGSFEDKIFASFMSDGGTANNHTWIGTVKPLSGFEFDAGDNIGAPIPLWTKSDFRGYNAFGLFRGYFKGYSATEGIVYTEWSGGTNAGTAFTSYLVTAALSIGDMEVLWRWLFAYSKATAAYNIYFRFRKDANDWSAWSTAIAIALSSRVCRSAKKPLSNSNGAIVADFLQFKIETTSTDLEFAFAALNVFVDAKGVGRP